MRVKDWLKKVAHIGNSTIPGDDGLVYYSKYDNSYITRVGQENNVKFLADREITQYLSHGTGFSPKDNKWYGWSHRSIFGFTIGSTCKKGDCHYKGRTIEEEIDRAVAFWHDAEFHVWTAGKAMPDGSIEISWLYNNKVPNEKLRGKIERMPWTPRYGKGEWTAMTMEDARQMAIDFNEAVS